MTALYPLICLLLARVVLKERINALQGAAIVLALCSALLLLLPA
jgi:EamA domain-containing membrane protein RarD